MLNANPYEAQYPYVGDTTLRPPSASLATLAESTYGGGPVVGTTGTGKPTVSAIYDLYQTYLGRQPEPAALAAHLKNPQGIEGIKATILSSPEYAGRAKTTTPGTTSTTAGATTTRTGWGFNTPTGGKQEFSYTAKDYGPIGAYSGFEPSKIADNESIKYVFLRATGGLEPTVENLDTLVQRLQEMGLSGARRVGYDKIDFGLGEGPTDVINQTRGGVWDWMPDEAMGATSATASNLSLVPGLSLPTTSTTPTSTQTGWGTGLTAETPATTPATGETSATDSRFVQEAVAPYFQANGVQVLEVQGTRMRVLTAEDQQQGNVYGRWIEVTVPQVPSLATLAR